MKTRKIYIILFIVLYAFVALVSGIHGFAFFGLANVPLLAVMLAIAFEIGQAAVLFSILTDASQRRKVMPWVLMGIFTLVQIMGNVYNSYKYLITNAEANLRFFKEPIFIWITDMPDAQADVILSYIQGAILPICALLLTSMVASFLTKKDEEPIEVEYVEEEPEVEEKPEDEEEPKVDDVPNSDEDTANDEPSIEEKPKITIDKETGLVDIHTNTLTNPTDYNIPTAEKPVKENIETIPQEETENKSHFLNI